MIYYPSYTIYYLLNVIYGYLWGVISYFNKGSVVINKMKIITFDYEEEIHSNWEEKQYKVTTDIIQIP